jgi:hypothetical protein
LRNNVWHQVFPVVFAKNISAQVFRNLGKLLTVDDSPGPPLEKVGHPGLRSWTWGILKEIYNVVPENLVVEISIYSTPGSDVGKCKSVKGEARLQG